MRPLLTFLLLLCVALPSGADRRGILLSKKPVAAAGGGATYTDTFDGRTEDPLSNGGTWTITETSWSVSGDAAVADPSGSVCAAYVNAPTFAADQSASIVIGVNGRGPAVRMQGGADSSCYVAYLASSAIIRVYKYVEGAGFTQLGADISQATATDDTLTLEVSGTTLTVKVNSVTIDTRSDGTFATGQPGIFALGGGTIKSFTAADL